MASLRDIRRRIKGVKNIRQVTRAMNMIAAARLRRAQTKALSARPYAERLSEILQDVVASSGGSSRHPLMAERETKNVALVLITSDRGLCGPFNAGIFLTAGEAFVLLRQNGGELSVSDLAPTPVREVLCRCCRNLVLHYTAASQPDHAALFADFVAEFESTHQRHAQP